MASEGASLPITTRLWTLQNVATFVLLRRRSTQVPTVPIRRLQSINFKNGAKWSRGFIAIWVQQGNENRFETEQQCLSACQYSDSETAAPAQPAGTPSEETKKEYSPIISKSFSLGHYIHTVYNLLLCLPDVGPVVTLPAVVPSAKNSSRPQRCSLPMQTGPCRMSLEMFYFDTEQQDCLSFLYGGCKVIHLPLTPRAIKLMLKFFLF